VSSGKFRDCSKIIVDKRQKIRNPIQFHTSACISIGEKRDETCAKKIDEESPEDKLYLIERTQLPLPVKTGLELSG